MLAQPTKAPDALAAELNLIQQRDVAVIGNLVQQILDANPNEVARFRSGDKKLQGFFMGLVMRASKGIADPQAATQVLLEKLNQK